MSGFCGWIGFEATETARREMLTAMVGSMAGGDRGAAEARFAKRAALAVPPHGSDVSFHEDGNVLAVVQGRVSFDDPVMNTDARERGAAFALTRGYRGGGSRVLESLRGGFALALIDGDARTALLAIDKIGGRYPLSYTAHDGCLVFGTRARSIALHPCGGMELDPQGIYNYLFFNVVPGPGTLRKGVERLMPGSYLEFRSGQARIGKYWEIDYAEDRDRPLRARVEELHELLRISVGRDAEGATVGCFLSGGIDSSTVSGMLGNVAGQRVATYSIGFDVAGYDEMEYARATATHFGTRQREYYVRPEDVVSLIPRLAGAYSDPFGNASAVPAYYCARMAVDDGVERLLGGDGGDELFAGNERYVTQHILGLYDHIPRALRSGVVEPVVFGFPGGEGLLPIRKLRSFIRQARIPMPRRLETYNHLERFGVETVCEPEFLAHVRPEQPLEILAETYDSARAENMLNRMLALDLRITLADNDLPKVSRMCELAGVEVAFPWLSDELIEFAARLPARLKLRGFRLRWFVKHALRDYLPRKVLRKKKHGFGLPFGRWMIEHAPLRELALDSLETLKRRGIVRPVFIDELTHRHQTEHADYYGVMIWVLMMLEQWFRVDRSTHAALGGGGPGSIPSLGTVGALGTSEVIV
jgi:asparagine synthase (glutamine-hydrolysing)